MVQERFDICILNKVSPDRLIKVRQDMEKLGTPIIKCFKLKENVYLAIEGSHRITVAKEKGITPILNVMCELSEFYEEDRIHYIDFERRMKKGLLISFP